MRVRFRGFALDGERRELWCGAERLHLPPKAFQLLQILVDRRPRAVAQQELYDLLWPDTFVERTNIHNLVYQLRKALGEEGAEIIHTVYGFGFSFAAATVDDGEVSSYPT